MEEMEMTMKKVNTKSKAKKGAMLGNKVSNQNIN
jgi:hypothetical protein